MILYTEPTFIFFFAPAAWSGCSELVRFLLQLPGARVDARNRSFWTPLLTAAAAGHAEVCAVLLTCCSLILIIITLPLSLIWTIKVVQVTTKNLL